MAETSTDMADHVAEAAEAASGGLPQLDFSTFPNQIFWLVVALLAIYHILTRHALPRIAGVLAERQGSITNDLTMAEELKRKAASAEAAYEKALSDARAESARIIGETRASIQAELDEAIAKADARISERTAEGERRIAEINADASTAATAAAREAAQDIAALFGVTADSAQIDAALAQPRKG